MGRKGTNKSAYWWEWILSAPVLLLATIGLCIEEEMIILTLAALTLMVVITVQNIKVPALREETVSDGLMGPTHWWLDGAYCFLIGSLLYAFHASGIAAVVCSSVAAASLFITMISNTFSGFVDRFTGGRHADIHTWFSILMFLSMVGLEITVNHDWLWYVSGAGLGLPALVGTVLWFVKKPGVVIGPQIEKVAIFGLCCWLISWSFA